MPVGIARRAENITEMTVEILDVRIATQNEFVLSKTKRLKQDVIVETFRVLNVRHCDVDMVDSCDFSHDDEMWIRGLTLSLKARSPVIKFYKTEY